MVHLARTIRHAAFGRRLAAVSRAGAGAWACALALGACTSAPPLECAPVARIESVPTGARCVTTRGEVFTTPATVTVPRGPLRFQVELSGHASRQVAVMTAPDRASTLGSFGACALVQVLAGGEWEKVEAIDGRAVVMLEPLVTIPVDEPSAQR